MTTARIPMILIDDHPLFRRGLAGMFASSADFEVVGEAPNGRAGIEMACLRRPRLILLDLHMPGLSGLQVLDEIKQLLPETLVIIMTASLDRKELLEALRLGVNGYMLKETEPDEVVAYVRRCSKGAVVLNNEMVSMLSTNHHATEPRPASDIGLTAREGQTLAHIAQGLSNKQIARELGISDGTVKIHVKNLLRKLRLHSRLEVAAWVYRTSHAAAPRTGGNDDKATQEASSGP